MAEKGPAARVALIGIQAAGKTTLFSALSATDYTKNVGNAGKLTGAVIRVLDPRLIEAHEKNGPTKKLVVPSLEVLDAPAIGISDPAKQDNPGIFAQVREADGFIAVIKAYDADGDRKKAAAAELDAIRSELYLTDVDIMQKRIEKLKADTKRALPNAEEIKKELAVLEQLIDAVAGGNVEPLKNLKEEDEKKLRGFQLFSRKPLIPLINISESDLADPPKPSPDSIPICLKLEMELMAMEEAERTSFMGDYGLKSLTLPGLAVQLYGLMGYQTFLTLGEKDTTAWSLRKGSTAWDAAGKIHTDIQKGMLNCEVISFADFQKSKSADHAPKKVEGKTHPLADYDIINIKTTAR